VILSHPLWDGATLRGEWLRQFEIFTMPASARPALFDGNQCIEQKH
jgi:hypothetical protein